MNELKKYPVIIISEHNWFGGYKCYLFSDGVEMTFSWGWLAAIQNLFLVLTFGNWFPGK